MDIIKGYQSLSRRIPHPVVTIGNFDGVHLGHQKILQLAVEKARLRGGQTVVYTFRPHPQVALKPDTQLQLLATYDEKLEELEKNGADITIEEPFSRDFSFIEPEGFFTDILLGKIGAEAIVVGYDFAFGKGRHGHLDVLAEYCRKSGVELNVVPPQKNLGEVVSSTKIRHYLLAGKIEDANRLLGRAFSYRGIVIKGDGRGKKIGFPTANLKLENKLALPYGVYATLTIQMANGKVFPSVTNVGVRPTFHQEQRDLPVLVESHLLDSAEDLYGQTLEVRFQSRLRDERKFEGVGQLKEQIQLDCDSARKVLKF